MINFAQKIQDIQQDLQKHDLSLLFEVAYQYAEEETYEQYCDEDEKIWINETEVQIGTQTQYDCDADIRNEKAEQYFINRLEEYAMKMYSPIHVAIMDAIPNNIWLQLFRDADNYIERNDPYREPYNFYKWEIVDADKMTPEQLQGIKVGEIEHDGYLKDRTGGKYYLFSEPN